jgi:ATP-dependent RNA helicase DDX10/DBP4
MTAIQNACIPHAVAVRDILGAALTGSGKTFALVNPMLECLYHNQMQPSDGPGAVVLSSTWELAVQIFEMVHVMGAHHRLSARLLVGGKKEFYLEQRHVGRTKIFIATPGPLLQHLEQTPDFNMLQVIVKVLVLDEANRAREKDQTREKHCKRRLHKKGKKDNDEA